MTLTLALILDALLGEPERLWSRYPHPAVLMGRAVAWFEARLNKGAGRREKGVLTVAALVVATGLIGWVIALVPDFGLLEIIVAAILLAQKSLVQHVHAVGEALRQSVREGRQAVSMIVGRDTSDMDRSAITRATIESAAENLSDGVVAPAFWFLIAGLPGLMVYKIVNTADSMIGYRTPRYEAFGWAAARLDDVLNWVPARATALLILASHFAMEYWHRVPNDARQHRSPNAGWPEAAMAPLIGVALSGPRSYDGVVEDFAWVNPTGRRDIGPGEIDRTVSALWRTWAGLLAVVFLWEGLLLSLSLLVAAYSP
ncbi:adenosylcobinamide-phosphate synthase CbiB [Jannaschia pohangensis]|uniref:Cobalamin biosynthesis protein CobD n=1 Tax=Jannaschia pohangensis TaxID=390807 RepID=A0A1I3M400_9RHOB|nr:adenosylcobinamide-phosphate synthase CbiB [Jannaschia pohangensis]SFI91692.1 adenosylcobinamide-phosphate synthase [Jannaschia pohangensis]